MESATAPQSTEHALGNDFWQPVELKLDENPFTGKKAGREVSLFFFKLKNPNGKYDLSNQKRFYPLGARELEQWRIKNDDEISTYYGKLFVPEKYFIQWIIDSSDAKKKLESGIRYHGNAFPAIDQLKKSHRKFTNLREWKGPLECRDSAGKEKGQLVLEGSSGLKTLYKLLRQGQDRCASVEDGPYWQTFSEDIVQDLGSHIPENGLYVKLHSDQVGKLYTAGAGAPQIEEVYIPQQAMNYFSGIELIHPQYPIVQFSEPDRKTFWVRNERGRPFELKVDNDRGLERDCWVARYRKAARSLESAGGWNRCINPAIDIFIVPCLVSDYEFLKKCIIAANNKRTTRQRVHLVTSQNLEKLVPSLHNLGRSPLEHYETWISNDDWNEYHQAYPQRKQVDSHVAWQIDGSLAERKHSEAVAMEESIKHSLLAESPTRSITIELTADKMKAARGKRDEVLTQNEVMGASANQIAKLFGWTDTGSPVSGSGKWPSPGVWPAEWLHRAAFSWGGLNGNYHTSQIPKNLIFGTSECNSIMTRYEKAFQDFVKRSAATHSTVKFQLHTETYGAPYPGPQLPEWLCYIMSYHFSVIEGTNVKKYSVNFHPFQRGFFTWFEQDLDSAILDGMFGGELPLKDALNIAQQYDEEASPEIDGRYEALLPEMDEQEGEIPTFDQDPPVSGLNGGLGYDAEENIFKGGQYFGMIQDYYT